MSAQTSAPFSTAFSQISDACIMHSNSCACCSFGMTIFDNRHKGTCNIRFICYSAIHITKHFCDLSKKSSAVSLKVSFIHVPCRSYSPPCSPCLFCFAEDAIWTTCCIAILDFLCKLLCLLYSATSRNVFSIKAVYFLPVLYRLLLQQKRFVWVLVP